MARSTASSSALAAALMMLVRLRHGLASYSRTAPCRARRISSSVECVPGPTRFEQARGLGRTVAERHQRIVGLGSRRSPRACGARTPAACRRGCRRGRASPRSAARRSCARCPARASARRRPRPARTARNPLTLMPDSSARAIFGPTPETLIRLRNRRRSASVAKPYSTCASSRTTRCVSRCTSAPTRRQVKEGRHRRLELVADPADLDGQLRRCLGGDAAAQRADHRPPGAARRPAARERARVRMTHGHRERIGRIRAAALRERAAARGSCGPPGTSRRRPMPTTASLMARGAYSNTGMPAGPRTAPRRAPGRA